MAADTSDAISYFLSLAHRDQHYLGSIRDWDNLKMGKEGELIWVTGFIESQIKALELQTIPHKQVYNAKDGKLFKLGSLLPSRNQPAVLWTPISRSLPVTLPDFNHNYFGLEARINVQLKPVATEQIAAALLTPLSVLGNYLATAPAIRLKSLSWVVVNQEKALIIGTPLLPISGKAYWQQHDSFLPLGYDFELPILSNAIHEALNPTSTNWLLWQENSEYTNIQKAFFEPLRLGAFRKTIQS